MAELKKTKGATPEPSAPVPYDWSQNQGAGFENVNREDLGIPFLVILQKGSPQIDPDHADHASKKIANAKVGDIIHSITNEILWTTGQPPLVFIPCTYERLYMEWKDRVSGGGMVKAHREAEILTECRRNEKGQDVMKNGNIIVTTAYFYGFLMEREERVACVIGLSSTQLKKARTWLNLMMTRKVQSTKGLITPPMFSHSYLLSTVAESNEKGNWRGWKVDSGPMVTDPNLIVDLIAYQKRATTMSSAALPPSPEGDDKY